MRVTICPKGVANYPPETLSKFNALKPLRTGKSNIRDYGNAFMIDTKGKMFRMDMRQDIIGLLGKIETPAEAQLALWLNHYEQGGRYRKVRNGYEIEIDQMIKGRCTRTFVFVKVDSQGKISDSKIRYDRKACKGREHTKYVENKTINYEYHTLIETDGKGSLYLLGVARKNKKYDAPSDYILDKYTLTGRKLWSRKVMSADDNSLNGLSVKNGIICIFSDKGRVAAKYSSSGKKLSAASDDCGKMRTKKPPKPSKYMPEGLPDSKEGKSAIINDFISDREGNIYIVGEEIFYPNGIPEGECSTGEDKNGALIAKLDKNGKTVWAKVIDGDE